MWYSIYNGLSIGRKAGDACMRIDVMGVGFDNVTMEEALQAAATEIKLHRGAYCVTPNAEIVWEAMHDESYRKLLNGASLVLPDGAGVIMGANILKRSLKSKVAGIDFADRLAEQLAQEKRSLYLLGSKPGIAEKAATNLQKKYPGLVIAGTADGYFKDEASVIEKIQQANPDVLFVCLGAPKQEIFMAKYQQILPVGLMAGLGGSLDGFAGVVKRAPRWMINCKLEWFYRLLKEPKRLGRMMRLPKFVLACKRQRRREAREEKKHG